MAQITPFRAIRPTADKAAQIAALPYDVYNSTEARQEAAKHPLSFLRIDRAEIQFAEGTSPYEGKVYEKARDTLQQMVAEGDFIRETDDCYYVYELTMNGRVQTGICACASIDDYENGIIKKHENTRAEKEKDRIQHIDTLNAQTGPIFLAYRSKEEINRIVTNAKNQEALYDFISEDGIRHRVFVINGENEKSAICEAFANISEIYIADGHHRAASAVKVGQKRRKEQPDFSGKEEFNRFLSVLFPDDQLLIMDYNRVVKDLNARSKEEFLQKITEQGVLLEKVQDVPVQAGTTKADDNQSKEQQSVQAGGLNALRPRKKSEFSMYLGDSWYRLTLPEHLKNNHPVLSLDVSLLQEHLLEPLLGIKDPRTDERIDFVGGIRGMEELERRVKTDSAVAFAVYPPSMKELFAVADAGELMPPKSTWFEPKLRSGLLIHEIL
ncbi:hypothetical protein FACS1894111_07360 [Clostridia bacterium]|nr:hypothetical protein FACS1894111_07360 [Clostridia bacterium]